MYKIFLLLACSLLITSSSLFAQKKSKGYFDIKAMLNIAYTYEKVGIQSINWDPVPGACVGISYQALIKGRVYVQPGVFYNGYGFAVSANQSPNNIDERYRYNYLSFPILANVKLGKARQAEVFGGPQVSLLLSAKGKQKGNSVTVDVSSLHKSTDVSFVVGGGYCFKKQPFFVSAMFVSGLTNIATNSSTYNGTVNNRAFSIGGGYRF